MSENPALNLKTVKVIEVLRKQGRWCIEVHYRDDERTDPYILNCFTLKRNARKAAISAAIFQSHQQGFSIQLHVKNRKGVIREHNTYGRDPRKTKG